jgi:hypothetical protein
MDNEFVPDSVVQSIVERFKKRAEFGYKKYGITLDRTDLSPDQWAQHALEEAHDFMLYIARWQVEQQKQKRLLNLLIKDNFTTNLLPLAEREELSQLVDWYNEYNK